MPLEITSEKSLISEIENCMTIATPKIQSQWCETRHGILFTVVGLMFGLLLMSVFARAGFPQQNEEGKKAADLRGASQASPPQFNAQWVPIAPQPTVPPPG